jgi:hypothetical protein
MGDFLACSIFLSLTGSSINFRDLTCQDVRSKKIRQFSQSKFSFLKTMHNRAFLVMAWVVHMDSSNTPFKRFVFESCILRGINIHLTSKEIL